MPFHTAAFYQLQVGAVALQTLGSRLIDNQSQNKTVAARAMAERKTFGQRCPRYELWQTALVNTNVRDATSMWGRAVTPDAYETAGHCSIKD
jgi:hypothetical protein